MSRHHLCELGLGRGRRRWVGGGVLCPVEVEHERHTARQHESVHRKAWQVHREHFPLAGVEVRPEAEREEHHVHRQRGEERGTHESIAELERSEEAKGCTAGVGQVEDGADQATTGKAEHEEDQGPDNLEAGHAEHHAEPKLQLRSRDRPLPRSTTAVGGEDEWAIRARGERPDEGTDLPLRQQEV